MAVSASGMDRKIAPSRLSLGGRPASRERRVETNTTADGATYKVLGSLPGGMSASRGRALMSTGVSLAMKTQMPFASCSPGNDQDIWSRYHEMKPNPDLEISAAVDLTESGAVVEVEWWMIRIQFDKDDQPVCWDAYVIVT